MAGSSLLLEASNRLRYEVLTKFATELGKAGSYEEVIPVLTDNAKYMVNFLTARIIVRVENYTILYQIHRSEGRIFLGEKHFYQFELEALVNGLPLQYSREQMLRMPGWEGSVFEKGRGNTFLFFPLNAHPGHEAIVILADKSEKAYNEVDHRFLKLLSELLVSKISQLWYLQQLDEKNQALQKSNARLDQLNARIQQMNRSLEDEVEARTRDLNQSNNELREIFYRTSHDFRSPLTSIRGLMNIAKYEASDNPALLDIFSQCERDTYKMDRMLDKLSKLSELNGKNHLPYEIDVRKLLKVVEYKFGPDALERGIDLEVSSKIDSCTAFADFHTLESTLTYLVENAISYCCEQVEKKFIRISATYETVGLVVRITDNGEGVSEGIQEKMFEMYFRGNERSQGHGLGLYVARKLVRSAGGELSYWPGEDTSFEVQIPVLDCCILEETEKVLEAVK